MATTAKIAKDRKLEKAVKAKTPGSAASTATAVGVAAGPRAFLRKFGVCRLCFRQLALNGEIPGVIKASW